MLTILCLISTIQVATFQGNEDHGRNTKHKTQPHYLHLTQKRSGKWISNQARSARVQGPRLI